MTRKKYTKAEREALILPKADQRQLAKEVKVGDDLPEGYFWSDTGSLHNPMGHRLTAPTMKPKEVSMKTQLLKYNGHNLNKIFKVMSEIASGKDKKATKLQFDACKYILDLYYNQELKAKTVNHSVEISFDEQLMKIAEKTKEQKQLNDNLKVIDV